MRVRGLVFSVALFLGSIGAAGAVEPPPGSRNFTPPANVPNYFNNEAGAIRGNAPSAAVPGTTYAVPNVRRRPVYVAPAPRYATRRVVRGRGGRYYVERTRGGARVRAVARGGRSIGRAVHGPVRHAAAGRSGGRGRR